MSRSARSIIRADKTTSKMQMRTPSFLGIGGAGGAAPDSSTLSRRANQEASGGSYTDYVASRVLDMASRGKKNDEAGAVAVVAWDWLALGALALAVVCLALMLV
ncbi:MAG: hypothetical protein H0U61_04060 [Nocardioidaceae bacterium]|nr:hypothetical protein [Nocardioidaceae bacterium]